MLQSSHLYGDFPFRRDPHRSVPFHTSKVLPWLYTQRIAGMKTFPAGRMNEAPSIGLSGSLRSAGFKLGRLQTGTPARLRASTINFADDRFEKQPGDVDPQPFSYMNRTVDNAVSALIVLPFVYEET